jgi:hypothetical protein
MKNELDKNFFISFVILIFRLFIIAFIVPFVLTLPLRSLNIISNFWNAHFFYSSFTFIYFAYVLVKKDEGRMVDFLLTKDFKDLKDETMKIPEIDDADLNTYSDKDVWRSNKYSEYYKSEKQFFYDTSNPCPYCDTKFKHTALHCAVYFNDIERLKETIEFFKKVDGVDDYTKGNLNHTLYRNIFNKKDFNDQNVLILAILMKNIDAIKLLTKTIAYQVEIYNGECTIECTGDIKKCNHWMNINPEDDESIKRVIDSYQYKKHQISKDVLDKDKYQEQQNLIKNEHEKRLRGN